MAAAHIVTLALILAAAALVVTGLALGSAGVEFGALALVGAAWLVRDSARSGTPTEPGEGVA